MSHVLKVNYFCNFVEFHKIQMRVFNIISILIYQLKYLQLDFNLLITYCSQIKK